MKLKIFLSLLFVAISTLNVEAKGWKKAIERSSVNCGTDLYSDAYAYKDENGYWRGIDADICRLFSFALFGNGDNIQMVQTSSNEAAKALKSGKIDVMLSQAPSMASLEVSGSTTPVEVMYYDNKIFLADAQENATSMEDYHGKKVCVVTNSEDAYYLDEFNERYALELKTLQFPSFQKAKEAFLLNRCQLISGSEPQMKSLFKVANSPRRQVQILPEIIAVKPVFVHIAPNNDLLRRQIKWILNAPLLAEHLKINSKNVDTFAASKDKSTQNLFGFNPSLWKKFALKPHGIKNAIKELGNYSEIYERNLGSGSQFNINRDKNNLIENGGLLNYQLFL